MPIEFGGTKNSMHNDKKNWPSEVGGKIFGVQLISCSTNATGNEEVVCGEEKYFLNT